MRIINSQKGDTILEVLVSMVVLAVVAGAAYATSTRSFHSALNSQYRDQAVTLAQQQIELLRSADSNTQISGFKSQTGAFCINSANPTAAVSSTSPACSNVNNAYSVSTVYTGNPPGGATNTSGYQTFKVTVTWLSAEGKTQTTTAYYKASDSFNDTASATCAGCSTSKTTNPPVGSITLSNNSGGATKAFGSTVTLTWVPSNVMPGSCVTVNGPWSPTGAKPNSGTETSGALNNAPITTFTLNCKDLVGNDIFGSTSVNVSSAPQPSLNFYADTNAVPPGGNTNLHWTTNNVPSNSCSASGSWGGTVASPGNQNTGALPAGNYTYTLTCNGYSGTTPAVKSVAIQSDVPPAITAFDTWSDRNIYTSQGAPRYMYWYNNASTTICNLSGYGNVPPNSYVYINVYPGTYTLTCYNSSGSPTSANFNFYYTPSYFMAYAHASFDPNWPGYVWGPIGEGYQGIPGDMSSMSVYGRAAVYDNYGNCASFYPGAAWGFYGWVQDYGLANDAFGAANVGKDCSGN
jgi:prepilin-type N-terminal cleavage/methylation domain-containing protein